MENNQGNNERNYYMVRAFNSSEEYFVINNVVCAGWSEVNFSSFHNSKELREEVKKEYYSTNTNASVVSRKLNTVERFKNIKEGDYIIVPYGAYIILAIAKKEEKYVEEVKDSKDIANQRKVDYKIKNTEKELVKIPRKNLKEGLQKRLKMPGGIVLDLSEFKDEIEDIFKFAEEYSYTNKIIEEEEKKEKEFKEKLLENLKSGKTGIKTGGVGFEELVREIMKCEGYEAEIFSKNEFERGIDADISAEKQDSFFKKKYLIQVKHHKGKSDKTGINQLKEVLKLVEYTEYEGIFITTATVDEEVREYGDENNIKVIDGEEFMKILYSNIFKLSPETKRKLKISSVPIIIE